MRRVILIDGIRDWARAGGRGRLRLDAPTLAVIGLSLALAVQIIRLAWLLATPAAAAAPVSAPGPDLAVLSRFDAFFRTGAQSALAESTAAGPSQMRLFGVRAGGAGEGSAIIGLGDGRQVSVGVGEEIEPGLTLVSVGADHAIVARGGSQSRLIFSETPLGAPPPPPPPPTPQVVGPTPSPAPTPTGGAAVDAGALMAQDALRPRMRGLAVDGFVIGDSAAAGALAAAGLQAGDVVTAVNGVPLNSVGKLGEARTALGSAGSATIQFERGGETRSITVRTGR